MASKRSTLLTRVSMLVWDSIHAHAGSCYQVYSNGLSEIILGNCIKKLGLPREEIVVMTKVMLPLSHLLYFVPYMRSLTQIWSPVADAHGTNLFFNGKTPEEVGIINQKGLSRKVSHSAV